jgi:galactokinase/mevalonate kinase-like predicted kinase
MHLSAMSNSSRVPIIFQFVGGGNDFPPWALQPAMGGKVVNTDECKRASTALRRGGVYLPCIEKQRLNRKNNEHTYLSGDECRG